MTNDYIHKEEVSKWLKQYGQDVLHGKYKFSLMYIWKNIMDLPPADVVQVVRCRDCKLCDCDTWWCDRGYIATKVKPDDFCSYGERREE